jgi:hypothetical protein
MEMAESRVGGRIHGAGNEHHAVVPSLGNGAPFSTFSSFGGDVTSVMAELMISAVISVVAELMVSDVTSVVAEIMVSDVISVVAELMVSDVTSVMAELRVSARVYRYQNTVECMCNNPAGFDQDANSSQTDVQFNS